MQFKPLGQHVIIIPDEVEDKTKGGIYIPDTVKPSMQTRTGKVLIIGQFVRERLPDGTVDTRPFTVKPGDHVLYGQYSGLDFDFDFGTGEKTYKQMREDEIIGIMSDDPE